MNECKAEEYKDNSVIFHSPIICWGFRDQPQCKYLKECLMDYQDDFSKVGKKRKFNNLLKKVIKQKEDTMPKGIGYGKGMRKKSKKKKSKK